MATKAKIDEQGRLVIPKPLRERLGLGPGTVIELEENQDGGLDLRLTENHWRMERRGRLMVKVWCGPEELKPAAAPLSVFEDTLEAVRSERVTAALGLPGEKPE